MSTLPNISYEQIVPAHKELLYDVFCELHPELTGIQGMEASQQEDIIKLQFQIRQEQLRQLYPNADFSLISIDGIPAGCLYIDTGSNIRIIEIGLLKKYRGIGVGSRIMRDIIDKADTLGINIYLQVLWFNKNAYQFYKKLGFQEIADNGIACEMKYTCKTGFVS